MRRQINKDNLYIWRYSARRAWWSPIPR